MAVQFLLTSGPPLIAVLEAPSKWIAAVRADITSVGFDRGLVIW